MLIMLWGLAAERPLAAVHGELRRLGCPVVLFNQHDILETELDLTVGSDVCGALCTRGERWELCSVTAVYVRPYDARAVPAVKRQGPDSPAWRHAVAVDEALWSWVDVTPSLVVNPPHAMGSNSSKPYQLELIRRSGFGVPDTLVTTDPRAVEAFWERHGTLIYKSISGTRSIVSRLRPQDRERLADVVFCPTQFQAYIRGTDVRVHVVGDEVFASEVITEADDYRYHGDHGLEIRACAVPVAVADRCHALASTLGLPVAGIDLRRTSEGEWYCFEVNPSPAFTYYQESTGQPISAAIARLLASGMARESVCPICADGPTDSIPAAMLEVGATALADVAVR